MTTLWNLANWTHIIIFARSHTFNELSAAFVGCGWAQQEASSRPLLAAKEYSNCHLISLRHARFFRAFESKFQIHNPVCDNCNSRCPGFINQITSHLCPAVIIVFNHVNLDRPFLVTSNAWLKNISHVLHNITERVIRRTTVHICTYMLISVWFLLFMVCTLLGMIVKKVSYRRVLSWVSSKEHTVISRPCMLFLHSITPPLAMVSST